MSYSHKYGHPKKRYTIRILSFLMDNPLLGIVYLDKQYRIVRCNVKFEEMFGYKLEEIKRENLDEVVDGDQDMTMITQTGESIHGSGKRKRRNGTYMDVEIYGIPKILGGSISGTLGIYLDITDRKLAAETIVKSQHELEERVKERTAELIRVNKQLQEEIVVREQTQKKLIESEEEYRTYIEHANDGISVVHKGKITFVNSRLAEIMGYKVDELVGKDFLQFIPKGKLNQITDNLKRRLAGEEVPQVYESRILHKASSEIDVEFNVTTIKSNDEPATLTIIRDITERKQAEETLRESEEKYRALFSNAQVALFRTRISDGKLVQINERYAKMAGYSTVEDCMAEFNAADAWANPNARNELLRILKENGSVNDFETEIIRRNGSRIWILFSATIFPKQGFLEGSIVDINERKQVEEALRESERKYRSTVENISDGFFILAGEDLIVTYSNFAAEELLGRKAKDILGKPLFEAFPEAKGSVFEKKYRQTYQTKKFLSFEIYFGVKPYENWYDVRVYPGDQSISVFFQITTERKRGEEALRESESRHRQFVENAVLGLFQVTKEGKFLMVNQRMSNIFGYDSQQDFFADVDNIIKLYVNPEERSNVLQEIDERGHIDGREMSFKGKDGDPIFCNAHVRSTQNEDGKYIYEGLLEDVTEKKKMVAQLQQAQKMEAISILAGGVAHEFNNTLMGIMGNIELLKINFSDDGGIDKQLESMEGAGHRMSRLTAQLLAYAEGGKYQPKDLKLDDFVIETLPILQHNLSPTVRVETVFPKDISYISADNAQMQMVLSAILTNSNEAIEDEGIIRITAENKDLDENFTKQHPGLEPGYYVCLTIEDDGKGMDEETKSGIFEPFFTTKFQGRGMGMAAVYGIVMNHDGGISVDSELGRGTTVRIYLPTIEIEIEKPKEAKSDVSTGSGTILMIEDEDVVIEVTQAMLEMLGYRVMVTKTGKDAIHIAETFDGQIDLALLDIKLPDIDGRNLYPLIMKARSNLKVIVCSGYSIDGPAREILDAGAQDFIQKPFSVSALSEKLKEVFEGK